MVTLLKLFSNQRCKSNFSKDELVSTLIRVGLYSVCEMTFVYGLQVVLIVPN